ncbi:Apoptosis-inducing factor 2 [Phytophthora boehmeriae]|uniref:Apoptosis-inducing factor 2 n=1 Tax=Phytophthora boehmeriae TaxID=109152 RepID=A0A8T1W7P4_9STRA|nr:Apoptosis-inducing factor 2 [Phytophthora boehmeriae]
MPRIVVIGGGPAGLAVAQSLAAELTPKDDTEVIVFEKSKFYYHAVGTPRAFVDGNYTNKLFIPYDSAIPESAKGFVKFQRAIVTEIIPTAQEVEFTSIDHNDEPDSAAKRLSYNYLVIATGSTYTVPIKQAKLNFKRSTTEEKLAEVREQIKAANSVLIVGGGAVGVEVAGEIKTKYPNKTVTILEAKGELVANDNVREKFRTKLSTYLERLGVKVIMGERLTERMSGNSFEKRTLSTDKGTEIHSDVQLLCGGFCPTTELIQKMDSSLVTVEGFIKVTKQLQLDSAKYSNIYALGDASNSPAPKRAYFAGQQGKHLGGELALVVRKKQTNVSKAFPDVEVEGTLLPLGPDGGISQLPLFGGLVLGDWVTKAIKSKDYFAGMTWKSMGAVVPN